MTCAGTGPPRRSLSERAERVIGILAELEARERMDRSVPPT
jgi:hypothetical protein